MIPENTSQVNISWIAEYRYCPRRFYLKVLEATDGMNEFIASGLAAHAFVHDAKVEKRGNSIKVTGAHVFSKRYNLYGVCDSLEFVADENGPYIPFLNGHYNITVVEYKRGKKKRSDEYGLQLTAQIICLEEMYQSTIEEGYLYYTDSHQRVKIPIADEMRTEVMKTASKIQDFISRPILIPARYFKRCSRCSVVDVCNPKGQMVDRYMKKLWKMVKTDDSGSENTISE